MCKTSWKRRILLDPSASHRLADHVPSGDEEDREAGAERQPSRAHPPPAWPQSYLFVGQRLTEYGKIGFLVKHPWDEGCLVKPGKVWDVLRFGNIRGMAAGVGGSYPRF